MEYSIDIRMIGCDKMKCPHCGARNKETQKRCKKCRKLLKKEKSEDNIIVLEEKDRRSGIIIAILLFTPLVLFGLFVIFYVLLKLLK